MTPTTRRVALAVLAEYGLGSDELERLESPRQAAPWVEARQLVAWLMRRLYGTSYPRLGEELGGRDHTTMMSAVRKVERHVARGGELGALALRLLDELTRSSASTREPTLLDLEDPGSPMSIELDLEDRPIGAAQ